MFEEAQNNTENADNKLKFSILSDEECYFDLECKNEKCQQRFKIYSKDLFEKSSDTIYFHSVGSMLLPVIK